MTEKNGVLKSIIAVTLIAIILIGLIVGTFLIEKKESKEWEYTPSDTPVDYFNGYTEDDFQYVVSFENALASCFSDTIRKYTGIDNYITKFTKKVVTAMENARVPAKKLKLLSENILKDKNIDVIKILRDDMKNYSSLEEWEQSFLTRTQKFQLISNIGKGINKICEFSALTEDEMASFVYHYLRLYTNEKYASYLKLVNEDFFTQVFSNTLYVIKTLEQAENSAYQNRATAEAIRAVCYQLGSSYARILAVPGGTELIERVLWITWDYDKSFAEHEKLNEISSAIRGKIGALFGFVGYTLQEISVKDAQIIISKNEDEQTDRIIKAICYAKLINNAYTKMTLQDAGKSFNDFTTQYAFVTKKLYDMVYLIMQGFSDEEIQKDEKEYGELMKMIDSKYQKLAESVISLQKIELTEKEICDLDKESEEFQALIANCDAFYEGLSGLDSLLIDTALVMTANAYNIMMENANAENNN